LARPRSAVSRYKHRKNIDRLRVREAVLYARVSTPDQQREGYSIPAQIKLLEDYAALNGIVVVSSHVDVETARKSGRTAFGNMLRYLKRNPEVRIILVEKTDRLYRNLKDWAIIDDLGVEVHFVKENVVMSDDCRSSEKFVHGIKVLMAKAYIDNLSEETRKGMLEKAQQGHWPSFAPIGYLNVRDGQGKSVIAVDPARGPMVARLFDWYATGLYSLKEVTAKAREAGICYRRSGRPIGASTIHNILRNRLYAGSFEWLGETYQGVHEPLVSAGIWDAVQQVMDGCSATNVRAKPQRFPFTGLVKCGHCGCALVAQMQREKYIYYHCSGFRGKCPEPYLRQEALEEHFVDLLKKLRCSRQEFEAIRDGLAHMDSGGELPAGQVALSRHRNPLPGTPGALLHDGLALLDMGRTAHLHLANLPDEMKQQVLSLIFLRSSWANGELTGWFNSPFDILADHLSESGVRPRAMPIARLSDALCHAAPEIRLLIARYNAMSRTRAGQGDDNPLGPKKIGPGAGCPKLCNSLPDADVRTSGGCHAYVRWRSYSHFSAVKISKAFRVVERIGFASNLKLLLIALSVNRSDRMVLAGSIYGARLPMSNGMAQMAMSSHIPSARQGIWLPGSMRRATISPGTAAASLALSLTGSAMLSRKRAGSPSVSPADNSRPLRARSRSCGRTIANFESRRCSKFGDRMIRTARSRCFRRSGTRRKVRHLYWRWRAS